MTATTRPSSASQPTTTTATAMASLNIAATTTSTLVALDANLADLPVLLAGLSPGVEALLVPADADAIALISAALQASGATRLALVAHGAPGQVFLGDGGLDADLLAKRGVELRQWGVEQIDL